MTLIPGALTTLTAVRNKLRLTDFSQDVILEDLINEVSDTFVEVCGRKFHYEAGIVEKVKGQGTTLIVVNRTPIISIASITVNGTVLDASGYSIDNAEAGTIFRGTGWTWTNRFAAGVTYDAYPGSEEKSIAVTYTGGWVTPAQAAADLTLTRNMTYALERLCIDAVVASYRDFGVNQSITVEKFQGASATFERDEFGLPPTVTKGLRRWTRLAQA